MIGRIPGQTLYIFGTISGSGRGRTRRRVIFYTAIKQPSTPPPAPLHLTDEALDAAGYPRLSYDDLDRIRATPNFEAVFSATAARYAEGSHDGHYKELRHVREMVGGVLALFLHHRPGGLSLATLRELCASAKIHKALALGLLAYLRFLRFIEPLPKDGDRRLQVFAPTAAMTALYRERFRLELELTKDLDPDIAALEARYDEPGVFEAVIDCLAVNLIRAGRSDVFYEEPLRGFTHRTNGFILLFQLMVGGAPGDTVPASGPIRYRVSTLARSARLSRMQVMRLINDGVKANLFERLDATTVQATPRLQEALRNFFAAQTLAYGGCARWALSTVPKAERAA